MNEYDTELVKSILAKENYAFVTNEHDADIVMLNTCAIREHAHRKVYGRIHKIKYDRKDKPVKIGILGCMATNLRTDLLENKNLDIDFIAGPDSYKRLPALIAESYGEGSKPFDLTLSEFETYSDVYPKREKGVNAWIAVMRGCNNFCTFCVVPYTRGRERSREPQNVVDEVKHLVSEGFKQVTLLGQNVNSYKYDKYDFADLMQMVSDVDGLERIRFTSPHPKDFPGKFLDVMAKNSKICKQIHFPLQSGNNRILDLMNRTYTREEFLGLIDQMRDRIPGLALSTDVIVGFCSETDTEFEDTYNALKQVEFDTAFMFKYSQRKNTAAEKKMKDDVPEAIKTERIVRLNELQSGIALRKNEAHVGETLKVLVESLEANKSKDYSFGRADNNKSVIIERQKGYNAGDMIDVNITSASPNVLRGKFI